VATTASADRATRAITAWGCSANQARIPGTERVVPPRPTSQSDKPAFIINTVGRDGRSVSTATVPQKAIPWSATRVTIRGETHAIPAAGEKSIGRDLLGGEANARREGAEGATTTLASTEDRVHAFPKSR